MRFLLNKNHIKLRSVRFCLFTPSAINSLSPAKNISCFYHSDHSDPSASYLLHSSNMPVSAALPETLKAITATKIVELSKQRHNYESAKGKIISDAEQQTDLLSNVQALLDGACRLEGYTITSDEDEDYGLSDNLRNKRRFLRQAQADPSFSPDILRQFREELSRDLELKSQGHIHAEFFSKPVTEWLSDSEHAEVKPSQKSGQTMDSSTSFEELGRKEMHEQRAQWESLVFNKAETDRMAIQEYFNDLFTSDKANTEALETLRRETRLFGVSLESGNRPFDVDFLKTIIKGLTMTDLLSEEKNAILKTFSSNKEVMSEICDVLNMRLASLQRWTWSTAEGGAITLEMRRQLNGKYRVYMDEDVLDALMLHGIGLRWAVHFKTAFNRFFNSRAWLRSHRHISKADRERREYFLGDEDSKRHATVQDKRRDQYAADYFMTQLPEDIDEGARTYDGDSDDEGGAGEVRKGPLETKHSLLHLLITESLLATRLHGEFTVVRSDFKWFGPSLPHTTIFSVLRFFDVSETWINFFTRFLEAPLRFTQDGPKGEVRTRLTGVPMSHALSDVFGEVLLFCMDYAVNQKTSGSFLYRLHDDFWFWGQEKVCQQAWKTMTEFSSIMGIKFNEEKTGTVRLGSKTDNSSDTVSDDILPKGEVRWGFLRLDSQTGRFLVDQSQVDTHIKELTLQLSHCNSIFSWIQAYNAYLARFFTNNFGKPSFAFGRQHVDMMIDTFARIQRELFPQGVSVTDHLRRQIEDRFGVKDLPDAFFYWPIRMGGLELRNPLIPLFGMRDSLIISPQKMIERVLDKDEEDYAKAKEDFLKRDTGAGLGKQTNFKLARDIKDKGEEFMPMDEYLRYREERSQRLAYLYTALLEVPAEKEVAKTTQIANWLEGLSGGKRGMKRTFTEMKTEVANIALRAEGRRGAGKLKPGIHPDWNSMQPYWKWALAIHGAEAVKKYGGVRMVDAGRVPVGVVSVMKQGRVRWRG